MSEEKNFKSVEKTLKKSQELLHKVLNQNEKWRGSGSFGDTRNQDIKTEVGHAYNKARSFMSHLYDDIKRVHDALPKGQSQNGGIQAIEIHLKQLICQCKKNAGSPARYGANS